MEMQRSNWSMILPKATKHTTLFLNVCNTLLCEDIKTLYKKDAMPFLMNENEQIFGLKEAAVMTLLNKITK